MIDSKPSRRTFLKTVGITAAAHVVANNVNAEQSNVRQPNVLLIMTDDQGWGDIHSHDNNLIDTPVLDRLAASGIRFDRFFAGSGISTRARTRARDEFI